MLFTPGPVDLTKEIGAAQEKRMISHRGSEYHELHSRVVENARRLMDCDDAFIITGSGSAGIEACVASSVREGEKALVCHNGVFGERLLATCLLHGAAASGEKLGYGLGFSLERAKAAIDAAKPSFFGIVLNETSTAVCNDVRDACLYAKKSGALVFVDGVSGVGGHEFSMRLSGVDLCAVGSQKCIGAPPGLALVGASGGAIAHMKTVKPRTRYLDLNRFAEFSAKSETPFTPAISLIYALDEALAGVFREGLAARIGRHRKAGEFARARLSQAGFALLAEKGFESNTLTAFRVSSPEEEKGIRDALKARGFIVSGGMGELKGKVVRIGHMANFSQEKLAECVEAAVAWKKR
ncbi:MAG: aminotransferase class V-fold PLP-dependent enzyme [Candidatus ainarchaeum sp.]|nr:aminotransferase class V-fold PLP-dependent enzyme [Candidatus ainarchaeum sp.]